MTFLLGSSCFLIWCRYGRGLSLRANAGEPGLIGRSFFGYFPPSNRILLLRSCTKVRLDSDTSYPFFYSNVKHTYHRALGDFRFGTGLAWKTHCSFSVSILLVCLTCRRRPASNSNLTGLVGTFGTRRSRFIRFCSFTCLAWNLYLKKYHWK